MGNRGIVDVAVVAVAAVVAKLDEHDVEMDHLMHPSNRLGSTS